MPENSLASGQDFGASAAFQLGFFSRHCDSAILAESLSVLCTVVHPNVFAGIQRACDRQSDVSGSAQYLVTMADRAFDPSHPYRRFYDLGAALGDYLSAKLTTVDSPDARQVWACVRRVPKAMIKQGGCLHELAREAKGQQDLEALLKRVAKSRVGSPNDTEEHTEYLRMISQLPSDVREAVQSAETSNDITFVQEVSRDLVSVCVHRETGWDEATEARNKWIYEECYDGTVYKVIIHSLKNNKEWDPIDSIPGIKRAAREYAKRKGLPPPPRRQPGRRSSRK